MNLTPGLVEVLDGGQAGTDNFHYGPNGCSMLLLCLVAKDN